MFVERHLDTGLEAALFEWLDEEAEGTGGFGALKGRFIGVRREVEDRHIHLGGDHRGGLHAIHGAAQLDVHEDQVRSILQSGLDGQLAGADCSGHMVAEPAKHRLQVFGDDAFVLHDEDLGFVHDFFWMVSGKEISKVVPTPLRSSIVPSSWSVRVVTSCMPRDSVLRKSRPFGKPTPLSETVS
jgi:hypothetical protein